MKYQVKNLKTFNGRDGGGFEASLYKDGKRIATVFNEGCGGCTYYDFTDRTIEEAVRAELKALAVQNDPSCEGYAEADDLYIDHLLDCYENNRVAKKGILFKVDGLQEDMRLATGMTIESVLRKYPNAVIWNIATQEWN
jgi:hypothetical protein